MKAREPAVAGTFYYRDKEVLSDQLKKFFNIANSSKEFSNTSSSPSELVSKGSRIVISPHAGYVYSGQTAAYAAASLKPAKTFIVLGPNHHGIGPEFSIMGDGSWKTPLGSAEIDKNLSGILKKNCGFLEEDAKAHENEHSVEVQLPFLQYRFKNFKFVPVCINQEINPGFINKCKKLGETIADLSKGNKIGVVASSDFSHYVHLELANEVDGKVVETIKKLDVKQFFETIEKTNASVCGFGPIAVAMSAAKKLGLKAKVIQKSSSGDETGDFGSVVAYWAIGFE